MLLILISLLLSTTLTSVGWACESYEECINIAEMTKSPKMGDIVSPDAAVYFHSTKYEMLNHKNADELSVVILKAIAYKLADIEKKLDKQHPCSSGYGTIDKDGNIVCTK